MIQNKTNAFQFLQNVLSQLTIYYRRKEKKQLKRLQTSNLELKFEVEMKFQGLNTHPVIQVSKVEHKTTPAPFEVTYLEFEKNPNLPTLGYGRIVFYNPYSGPKYTTAF